MDLNKLSTGDKIVGGTGILLIIGLLFFPWHKVEIKFLNVSASETRQAIESPGSFWGIVALLLTIAIVAVLVVRRLTTASLPEIPISWNQAVFYGAIAVLALLVIKLLSETDFLGWGAWIDLLLAAGMVYGGFLVSKEPEVAAGGSTVADV